MVSGSVMKVEVAGTGDPLVLVPGGLTGWVSWKPHAEQLAATYRVVRVQLLVVEYGLDGTPLPPDYSVETESAALRRALDGLGIGRGGFAGGAFGPGGRLAFPLARE